ncbi:MAG TPA: UvrD-helicase domain-containing protein [Anaerolineae bacterium]|nr:UvrD-helicase domain-containing protein [Anaerolineae bacterium]
MKTYQQRFCWISVDEYQDINLAQYRLLRLLTAAEANLCAIGDPDQAIYGFRGARREYFLKFQQDFPRAKILHLSQNYRSTQLILDASGQVIAKGAAREPLEMWSDFVDQTRLEIYQAPSDKAEAEYTDLTIRLLTSTAFLLTYPNCSRQSANQSPTDGLFCLESYCLEDILTLRTNSENQHSRHTWEREGLYGYATAHLCKTQFKNG